MRNVTDFVTHRPLSETLCLGRLSADTVDSILLSSDGLAPIFVRGPLDDRFAFGHLAHPLTDAALDVWSEDEFTADLCSLEVWTRSTDDCSLALLQGTPGPNEVDIRLLSGATTRRPARALARTRRCFPVEVPIDDVEMARTAVAAAHGSGVWARTSAHLLAEDVALDRKGEPMGFVVCWPVGVPLVEDMTGRAPVNVVNAAIRDCIAALHDACHVHGSLHRGMFCIDAHGHVQLADPFCALTHPLDTRQARLERTVPCSVTRQVESTEVSPCIRDQRRWVWS